jgi:hypothetical protein
LVKAASDELAYRAGRAGFGEQALRRAGRELGGSYRFNQRSLDLPPRLEELCAVVSQIEPLLGCRVDACGVDRALKSSRRRSVIPHSFRVNESQSLPGLEGDVATRQRIGMMGGSGQGISRRLVILQHPLYRPQFQERPGLQFALAVLGQGMQGRSYGGQATCILYATLPEAVADGLPQLTVRLDRIRGRGWTDPDRHQERRNEQNRK